MNKIEIWNVIAILLLPVYSMFSIYKSDDDDDKNDENNNNKYGLSLEVSEIPNNGSII